MSGAPVRAFLSAFLAPLAPHLARGDVTDLYVNRPGELWLEGEHGTERVLAPELDDTALWWLARQIASASDQGISREHPLLAATLPDGARVQVCAPPATRGGVAFAIRRNVMPNLTLRELANGGAFTAMGAKRSDQEAADEALASRLEAGDVDGFLAAAVRGRKTIIVSGATGSGKTTFLNALLKEIPPAERLVLIEDTPEIVLEHENAVGLVATRGRLGEAAVIADDLVDAALRLRPDRIIIGEVRGSEALSWLRAAGSGHPGSITTVHASTPEGAIEQLALMALAARTELRREDLRALIGGVVDIQIQLGRTGGHRHVEAIEFFRRPRA